MEDGRNSLGRIYESRKALSGAFREEIIESYGQGFSANEIASDLKVTVREVMLIDSGQQRSIDQTSKLL